MNRLFDEVFVGRPAIETVTFCESVVESCALANPELNVKVGEPMEGEEAS